MDGRSRRRRRLVSAFGPFMKLNVGIIAPPLYPPPPPQGIKNELAAGGGGRRKRKQRSAGERDGGKRT